MFSERALSNHVESTVLPEQLPRGRAPAGQQLKQQLRENRTPDAVRVRMIVYYVYTSHLTHTARCAHRSLDFAPIHGAQADLLDQPAISRATPAAGPKHKNCRWCYSRSRSLLQELLPAIDIYDTAQRAQLAVAKTRC